MDIKINFDLSVGTILTIIFVVLKLIGIISWSWWWVFSPLWISVIIGLIVLFILWCDFNLGDFEGRPSYIRFLPLDIIDAWKEYQDSQHCIIEFDCEMWQFCLVIWEHNLIVINNKWGKNNCIFLDFNAEEVLNELVNEIVDNLDLWAEWISTTGTDKNIQRCREIIINRMNEVNMCTPYYKVGDE